MSVTKSRTNIIPLSARSLFICLVTCVFLCFLSLSLDAAAEDEYESKNQRISARVGIEDISSIFERISLLIQDIMSMIGSVIKSIQEGGGINNLNSSITVEFVSDQSRVRENAGQALIKVIASKPATVPISMFFTAVSGTAVAGTDFNFRNGIWIFPAGKKEVDLQIDIINDASIEPTESFSLAVTNIIGASPGSILSHTVVIEDDGRSIGVKKREIINKENSVHSSEHSIALEEKMTQAFPTEKDVLAGMPTGAGQLEIVCNRMSEMGVMNKVTEAFCGHGPPKINSIKDLQRLLGLEFQEKGNNNPAFALKGHSISSVMQFVNSINPNAIIFTPPEDDDDPNNELVAMGFVRGEQFVEIISAHFDPKHPNDPENGELQFYLFNFEKTCNTVDSCTHADLLTDEVEKNWTGWTLYHEEDIKNTILDCRQCHQPGGPGTAKSLLMQELESPWTHFFHNHHEGGRALLEDYMAAHGTDETYAGIPGNLIRGSDPAALKDLIKNNGFGNGFESNVKGGRFNARQIEAELESTGQSETWQKLFERHVAGEIIQVPYFGLRVTDPAKLQEMTQAYRAFKAGMITELPDIRDAFNESEMRNIGFKVKAGLDGTGILSHACAQCHNDQLDQSISRARFNVDLSQMSVAELKVAQQRINLPTEHLRVMPPERFRTLDAAERQILSDYLQRVMDEKSR